MTDGFSLITKPAQGQGGGEEGIVSLFLGFLLPLFPAGLIHDTGDAGGYEKCH